MPSKRHSQTTAAAKFPRSTQIIPGARPPGRASCRRLAQRASRSPQSRHRSARGPHRAGGDARHGGARGSHCRAVVDRASDAVAARARRAGLPPLAGRGPGERLAGLRARAPHRLRSRARRPRAGLEPRSGRGTRPSPPIGEAFEVRPRRLRPAAVAGAGGRRVGEPTLNRDRRKDGDHQIAR